MFAVMALKGALDKSPQQMILCCTQQCEQKNHTAVLVILKDFLLLIFSGSKW